ncbi:hypothetical protein GGS20DRAFT_120732 [Poronia punctata]|nr:hypothetical protein GGS20DRAFT_120732 [Poronia punctata]
MALNDETSAQPRGSDNGKESHVYETFNNSSNPERTVPSTAVPGAQAQPVKAPRPTFKEAFESISSEDFFKIHQIPCAREGLMTGIGAGTAFGMGRYIVGANAPKAANWAFGAFMLGSIIQWEYCQAQRRKERAAMARAVEVMNQQQAEKKARAREAARLKKLEAETAAEQAKTSKKSWYQFW